MSTQDRQSAAGAKKEYLILVHDGSRSGRKRLLRELAGAQPMLASAIRRAVKAFMASKANILVYMQPRNMPIGKTFHVASVEELAGELFPRIAKEEMAEGDSAHFLLAATPDLEQQIRSALQSGASTR